ncbi:MAG: ATP-binding protein [Planctomycetota bacterium]|nr:ATP-binding protein [Planctomycetota bacterium]
MSTATKPKLDRTTFTTSRLMEFCSEKELVNQTGHSSYDWPLVALKELVDNALDACEETDTPPVISVVVDDKGITISDNGPGIPDETVEKVLNYSVRVSSREAYVAPDRGAQGNALKTVLAMPFVLSEESQCGRVDISSAGKRHEITFKVDPIRQEPKVEQIVKSAHNVKNGTKISVHWPDIASEILSRQEDDFLQLASDFTFLNPHLTLTVDWFGEQTAVGATNPEWRKWKPSIPTSAHWYALEDIERLLAAYITHDQDNGGNRFVRDVVREFRGLSGTAKQKAVLDSCGMARAPLHSLCNDEGMDHKAVGALLAAMKKNSVEVKPSALGIIGKDHLRQRFVEHGCDEKTFRYKKILDVDDGIPVVIETTFALMKDDNTHRRTITGVNWSGAIGNPFRSLGESYHDGLDALLEKQMAGYCEPVLFCLHCACARVRYTDRGKTNVVIN